MRYLVLTAVLTHFPEVKHRPYLSFALSGQPRLARYESEKW